MKPDKKNKNNEKTEDAELEAAVKDGTAGEQEVADSIDKLKQELEKATSTCADYLDKIQRTGAEFENYRKRTLKEKSEMYDDGVRDTVLQILPVIDNFERALASSANTEDNFYKGILMIAKQFSSILENLGVMPIETVGQPFSTDLHAAVSHVDDENFGENEVIEELQKGYKYKDKVIRHSMVKVAN